MKKLTLLTITLAAIMTANAQIQMNSLGFISLGTTPPSSPYRLKVVGSVFFDYGSYSGIKIEDGGYYEKQIVPTSANTGYIGKSNLPFRYIYAQTITETSDKRQKENMDHFEK